MKKSKNDEFVFLPLGGSNEIGMNFNLYGFGPAHDRKWIVVDLGVTFGDQTTPGVEIILPDPTYIEPYADDILGIVLTHAHEDHFGALLDLWPKLKVPVYATPFTAALFEAKRLGEREAPEVPVKEVALGSRFQVGPFDIELCSVAHSIPESNALIIRTPHGNVLHTGDWKLDPTPIIGVPTDEAKLRALGDEGCLALIGDSTNAVREGRSPSEVDVAKTLAELIANAPSRVAVTTFASNVARVRAVAEAAHAAGREVVLVGRAMERVAQVARETGYLDGIREFRGIDMYGHLPRDKVVAICTGSQGEPRAALARIAADEHPEIGLSKGDRVIFSSRTIPGNEKAVSKIVNGLIDQGVEVITDRTHLVHVSGHPRRAELEELIGWVRPQLLIPVHGESLHLSEHAKLARSLGIQVGMCRNGDLVKLGPGDPGIVDEIPVGRVYKDGALLVEENSRAVVDRKRLSFAGIAFVAMAMTEKGQLASDPEIELVGIPEKSIGGASMLEIANDVVMETFETLPKPRRRDPDAVEESIRRAVRGALAQNWGKKPLVYVHVLIV